MYAFFLGHVFYIVALSLLAGDASLTLPLIVSGGASLLLTIGTIFGGKKMMGLNFGEFVIPTSAYSFILNFSMIYSLYLAIMGAGMWLMFVGLLLFFASDMVLSFQYFGGKLHNKPMIAINHTLYYAAQIILVACIFLI